MDSKATEHEEDGQAQEESRSRRKSFSKLLDRDKGDDSNGSSQGVPDKERDGSRGFMGSVRRIGKHKSGNGALLSISERSKAPPLPSSTKLPSPKARAKPSANTPYSLPPLPITSSQLSLRPPTPSSLDFQQNSRHSSMHDLPSVFCTADTPTRIVSTPSAQSPMCHFPHQPIRRGMRIVLLLTHRKHLSSIEEGQGFGQDLGRGSPQTAEVDVIEEP